MLTFDIFEFKTYHDLSIKEWWGDSAVSLVLAAVLGLATIQSASLYGCDAGRFGRDLSRCHNGN